MSLIPFAPFIRVNPWLESFLFFQLVDRVDDRGAGEEDSGFGK
jgi:hypothetical protein